MKHFRCALSADFLLKFVFTSLFPCFVYKDQIKGLELRRQVKKTPFTTVGQIKNTLQEAGIYENVSFQVHSGGVHSQNDENCVNVPIYMDLTVYY